MLYSDTADIQKKKDAIGEVFKPVVNLPARKVLHQRMNSGRQSERYRNAKRPSWIYKYFI